MSVQSRRQWLALAGLGSAAWVWGCKKDEPAKPAEPAKSDDPAKSAEPAKPAAGQTIRCAVIGGMMTTDFFPQLAKRFEQETGQKVEVVASGNKQIIAPAMVRGDADLITMHASDTIVNLVADGIAADPQPWARNDHVIVGPSDDPAKIRGMKNAGEAMRKILAAKSPFVVRRGNGTNVLLRAILTSAHLSLDDKTTLRLHDDENQEAALELAASKHAYSLVGFIPFKIGKIQGPGIEVMVEGDPLLRRPYLVAVANPKRWPAAHYEAAKQLVEYLRSPKTQAWIAEFGRTQFGGHPPFSPVSVEGEAKP